MYLVIQHEENGRYYAHVWHPNESENLAKHLQRKTIIAANAYKTKKRAVWLAQCYNDEWTARGVHMFNNEKNPLF